MAMMISKFHRLIQSRILWASFLVIVIFTFVVWGMQSPGRSRRYAESTAVGKLSGKFVSPAEYRDAYNHEYAGLVFSLGRSIPHSDALGQLLHDTAWRRLAALREAHRLGMGVTDGEIVQAIRTQPLFAENGRFSLPRYRAYLQNVVAEMGFTERFFEEHIRQELILSKLHYMVQQCVLVPPLDLQRTFTALTDRFRIVYATITREAVTNDVKVTDAQVRAQFDQNPEAYRVPPQMKVRYVFFPAAKYLPDVAAVDERDVEDYYQDHPAEFQVTDTNTAAKAEGKEKEEPEQPRKVTLPLDQVHDRIVAELKLEAARSRARSAADAFIKKVSTYFQEKPMKFDDAAKATGLTLYAPAPFSENERVPGISADLSFNEAAFELRNNPDEYFSRPVTGDDGVYVLALTERVPAHVPAFEDVADRVAADVRRQAVIDAVMARAEALRRTVADQDEPFAAAAKKLGLPVTEPQEAFSATEGLPDDPNSDVLVRGVLNSNPGEVTDPLPSPRGAVLVAQVLSRVPGDPGKLASQRPQVAAMLRRERGRQLFDSWENGLLRRENFEDLNPPKKSEGDAPAPEDEDA